MNWRRMPRLDAAACCFRLIQSWLVRISVTAPAVALSLEAVVAEGDVETSDVVVSASAENERNADEGRPRRRPVRMRVLRAMFCVAH